jgi:phosphotransferase system enzyme I (PtsP)
MIERARLVDASPSPEAQRARAAGGNTRRVTLAGRHAVAGRAVGAVCALRRPASRTRRDASQSIDAITAAYDMAVLQASRALDALDARGREIGMPEATSVLAHTRTILLDGRLRERVIERAKSEGLAGALLSAGGEASRNAMNAGDPFALERSRLIADACEAVAMFAAHDRRADIPRGAVLVGEALTVFDVLVSARAQPVAVVLSGRAETPASRATLALLGVPAVADVAGLFRWLTEGDIALVDADHGLVRINPSRAEIATVRAEKKQRV